jgi:hypothetical protein
MKWFYGSYVPNPVFQTVGIVTLTSLFVFCFVALALTGHSLIINGDPEFWTAWPFK